MAAEAVKSGSRSDRVLKNLRGIKSPAIIKSAEDEALLSVENKYLESEIVTADTQFTARIICRMHKDWLGDIYEWAGRYRTVDMSKGEFPFPQPGWFPSIWTRSSAGYWQSGLRAGAR
ncbi:MAG: Fic family protein [Thaumarchaeota archaeon]|nr:Fic family protein [Nitrososphaerota archaeon]